MVPVKLFEARELADRCFKGQKKDRKKKEKRRRKREVQTSGQRKMKKKEKKKKKLQQGKLAELAEFWGDCSSQIQASERELCNVAIAASNTLLATKGDCCVPAGFTVNSV